MPAGWNAVATQVTGYLVTAADWNDGVVYNVRYLKGQSGAVALEDDVAVDGMGLFLSPDSGTTGAVRVRAPASGNPAYIQFLNNAMAAELAHIGVTAAGLMSLGSANCKVDAAGNISPVGNVDGVDVSDHSARHENGGGDEISVAGLSGELADNQPPKAHHLTHENGGGDEIGVGGLSGLLADDQHVLDTEVTAVAVAKAGDTGLGAVFKRAVDDSYLQLHGGLTWGAHLDVTGKDYILSPGAIGGWVPNAAETGEVQAFAFLGCTDTPEMTVGVIPTARLKEYAIGSYTGNGAIIARQITTGFQCKFVMIRSHAVTDSFDAITTVYSFCHEIALDHAIETAVHLHATDGFVVGDGSTQGNENAYPYYYLALGE
ncbi:MAG: hypothetical protein A2Y91_03540 [Chloroflexi bacterium RBG_13_54_8]|nr:MAG: hypothetical protein A2Y91_03540 [Chloroflexi bacterium RBG_13_54_8]